VDVRSALMDAIASGVSTLRKVAEAGQGAPVSGELEEGKGDVASILANALISRRKQGKGKDEDEDDSDSDDSSSDGEWSD
jgi:hypothetical protein